MAGKPRNKPSIKEQIENAKAGDIIHISEGIYDTGGATIPNGVILEGESNEEDKLKTILIRKRIP